MMSSNNYALWKAVKENYPALENRAGKGGTRKTESYRAVYTPPTAEKCRQHHSKEAG